MSIQDSYTAWARQNPITPKAGRKPRASLGSTVNLIARRSPERGQCPSTVPAEAQEVPVLDSSTVTLIAPRPKRGHCAAAVPAEALSAAAISQRLVGLQRRRVFCIRQQVKMENATLGFIRYGLGQRHDTTEEAAKKLAAEARRIKAAIEKGDTTSAASSTVTIVVANKQARHVWDDLREDAEKDMVKLAKQLPVWPFVESVKGVGPLGLAVIAAEAVSDGADDLGCWRNRANLQKHLGLGVVRDGTRQRRLTDKEAAIEHGYNPHRRAELYSFLDDAMLRAQWRDGTPVQIYGEYYRSKKAEYLTRFAGQKGGDGHADKAARRYMAKMFIRDLYNEWRRASR